LWSIWGKRRGAKSIAPKELETRSTWVVIPVLLVSAGKEKVIEGIFEKLDAIHSGLNTEAA
jgi:hypothetical protein